MYRPSPDQFHRGSVAVCLMACAAMGPVSLYVITRGVETHSATSVGFSPLQCILHRAWGRRSFSTLRVLLLQVMYSAGVGDDCLLAAVFHIPPTRSATLCTLRTLRQ